MTHFSLNPSRALRTSLLLLPLAALLSACGGGSSGDGGGAGSPPPVITSSSASSVRYGETLLVTLTGSNLDQGLSLSSTACTGITRSTTAPNISTATTAYYTCTVSGGTGAQQVVVNRSSDNGLLANVAFTVPVPQVTLAMSRGNTLLGNVVITLSPAQAPITVNNFLAYVKSGFYDNTAFHRLVPNFVLQGGGYASPLDPSNPTAPVLKPTNPPIALEVGRGLSNIQWTIAMARANDLNSATSQFFINLVNNTALDTTAGGYAVFGHISAGTSVVTDIISGTCVAFPAVVAPPGCVPVPNAIIASATQTQ